MKVIQNTVNWLKIMTAWNLWMRIGNFVASQQLQMMLLGFRRDVDEICALLGYYAASCGNCLPTFGTTFGPIFKGQEPFHFFSDS
jgi:hypothetical protein